MKRRSQIIFEMALEELKINVSALKMSVITEKAPPEVHFDDLEQPDKKISVNTNTVHHDPNNSDDYKAENVYEWVKNNDFTLRSPTILSEIEKKNKLEKTLSPLTLHKRTNIPHSAPAKISTEIIAISSAAEMEMLNFSTVKRKLIQDFDNVTNNSTSKLATISSLDTEYLNRDLKTYTELSTVKSNSVISGTSEGNPENTHLSDSEIVPYQKNIKVISNILIPAVPSLQYTTDIVDTKVINDPYEFNSEEDQNVKVSSSVPPLQYTTDMLDTNDPYEFNSEEDQNIKNIRTSSETKDFFQQRSDDLNSESGTEDDDHRDNDFDIREYSDLDSSESSTDGDEDNLKEFNNDLGAVILESPKKIEAPTSAKTQTILRPQQTIISNRKKIIRCKFCEQDVSTKNFTRHVERHHINETEVQNILSFPKKSKQRRNAFILLRNDTNFSLFINGTIRPNREKVNTLEEHVEEYYPCAYCRGLFQRYYLKRHSKHCINKKDRKDHIGHLSASQTLTACSMDPTQVISKLNVKEKVFDQMKGDQIAFEAKKDILIANFGESYLKKHKRERMVYACSNRMRELARLLISYRKMTNDSKISLKEILLPQNFATVVSSVRDIAGYDHINKTFKVPSLASHLGTSLKHACNELIHLILQQSTGFKCETLEGKTNWLTEVKHFIKLIESRWTIELASLANKDMQEKKWSKPLLLPLVSDIKTFRDETIKFAESCEKKINENTDDKNTYKLLVQCSLALLILFNRRRIGDVQYLKISDYKCDRKTNFTDFKNALTESEHVLTSQYKRVLNSGKGSRQVVILVPKNLQRFINLLLDHRKKYIPPDNEYVFALPGSIVKWGKGDVAFKTLTKKIKNLSVPQAIGSNRLRKHIATVMQILNLTKDEAKQFAIFMGHTEKTHQEFYELPIDIYQTAKVSKLLLMMEKGSVPVEYKGKSLSEININPDMEYVDECNIEENYNVPENTSVPTSSIQHFQNCSSNISDANETVNYCDNDNSEISKLGFKRKRIHDRSSESDNNTDSEKSDPKKRKKKIIKRKGWSHKEVMLLTNAFQKYIQRGTYPSSEEIKTFLNKTSMNRTVVVIKSKIQHLMQLENKI